jgi:uncharacterized GH25 family protein
MNCKKIARFVLMTIFLLGLPCAMLAHDLFLIADNWLPKPGERVNVRMVVGHNFPDGSTLAMADKMKVTLLSPEGKISPLSLTKDGIYQVASFAPQSTGANVVMSEYKYFSTRTKAGKFISLPKTEVKEPVEYTTRVSRSAKIIIGTGGANTTKALGMDLEIIPQIDPTTLKAGDLLPVQILYKGKPIVPNRNEEIDVKAVYAGFQTDEDTYAFAGHTDKNAMCRVKLTQPGTWMIIVERRIPAADLSQAETELYGATLTFRING